MSPRTGVAGPGTGQEGTVTGAEGAGSLELPRRAVGVATFAFVIVLNGLAGSGALSGQSIGVIANRYPTTFLPASYVFGIWSLIYLGLLAFTVDLAVRPGRDAGLQRRLARLWPANGLLNVAWIVTFSFERFALSMVVMLALLANLLVIHRTIGDPRRLGPRDRIVTALPFNMYFAWISVAVIANGFQLAATLGWSGAGTAAEAWSVAMMTAATALGGYMALRRGVSVFPPVVGWALAGIALRFEGTPLITVPAWSLVGAGGIIFLIAVFRTAVSRPVRPRDEPGPSPSEP